MDVVTRLRHFGYAIEPAVIPPPVCDVLASTLDGLEAERRAKGTLFSREMQVVLHCIHEDRPAFRHFIDEPSIYSVVQQVLNSGEQIVLNSLSASRSVKVDDETWDANADAWRAHIDHRMPTPNFGHTASVCALICLDDFTADNGALQLWPHSHLANEKPPKDQSGLPPPMHCTAARGSVIYWLGQSWHAIGRNVSGARRWGLISQHCYWWQKPTFQYDDCSPDLYAKLTQRQKGLLGYNSRPPRHGEQRGYTVTPLEVIP